MQQDDEGLDDEYGGVPCHDRRGGSYGEGDYVEEYMEVRVSDVGE